MFSIPTLPLPEGISSHYASLSSVSLSMHYLSAGNSQDPLILLLHGFPDLAFSWRHIMVPLSAQGFHVVAPDQRGYGRTTGWDNRDFDEVNMKEFQVSSLVADLVALASFLGVSTENKIKCVIGHDFGAVSAGWFTLTRPDLCEGLVLMSHPFSGPPAPANATSKSANQNQGDIDAALASLDPPRKHYKDYNSAPSAAHDWLHPSQGLQVLLRDYFYVKSAAYGPNHAAGPLKSWTASELAKMPGYYIMPLDLSMPDTIAQMKLNSQDRDNESSTYTWLPDSDLSVYVAEWNRTGFQGALNWYRVATSPQLLDDLKEFSGRKIEVPMMFLSGKQDWGNWQTPGALEKMGTLCDQERWKGVRMVEGAGHWVQQEKPEEVVEALLSFTKALK
jgi:pimeloyl-ACP methyl ester carboxylesterase